jgi:hypothetical protein
MSAKKQERSFGLSAEQVEEFTAEYATTKRLPNPYRVGAYGYTIHALLKLGANKTHSLAKVHQAFKRAAGPEWYAEWAGAEKRNKKTGKDPDERFLQNLQVLQRTSDYALKLLQVGREVLKSKGAVIDMTRDDKGRLFVALNLNSDAPIKPGRSAVKARVAREPSGSNGKGTGGKGNAKDAGKRRTTRKAAQTPRKAAGEE